MLKCAKEQNLLKGGRSSFVPVRVWGWPVAETYQWADELAAEISLKRLNDMIKVVE